MIHVSRNGRSLWWLLRYTCLYCSHGRGACGEHGRDAQVVLKIRLL